MVVIENRFFVLKIGEECIAKSLINKINNDECLELNNTLPLFSLTQERPYNNELKLMHLNKCTTYNANHIYRENNRLIVGFESIKTQAVIEIAERDNYVAFTLVDFITPEDTYGVGCQFISPPPVYKFRILQLPVAKRERFGDWLNVEWDDNTAVNILSTSPYALIDSENKKDCRVLYAEALRDIKLKGCSAAIIVAPSDKLLDCIDSVEKDYDLPMGVKSRRSDIMNASIYWTCNINPSNVDEHIFYAKKGGFKKILIYYTAMCIEDGYKYTGDYDLNEFFPNGFKDLEEMLNKIKKAGIIPGLHFLHSHIGIKSRYVTPKADHRLNLTRYLTLSKPLEIDDTVIYVEQNPEGSPLNSLFQILKFDGEIIHYDSYTTEYPYCFKGCKRGYYNTDITNHSIGIIGGVLDVSEFGAMSVYTDERTSLQDEVAEKIAKIYNTGFEFVYFDGSEGTNPPFEFYISYAQYKVYKKLKKEPLFCEGAAKTHFGWHMLSGGNAFDVFPTNLFKEKIAEFPMRAAPKILNSFTGLNFGWWCFEECTQPDIYEYGLSKATAFDCPVTIQISLEKMLKNSRSDDILEVIYRWEDAKSKKIFTEQQKELLKNTQQEYIMILNEDNEYELTPYYRINNVAMGDSRMTAFYFERNKKTYVVCWHTSGEGKIFVPFLNDKFSYTQQIGGKTIDVKREKKGIILPLSKRSYFSSELSKKELIEIFENAHFI